MSRLARYGPVTAWALLLFVLSSIPGDEFAPIPQPFGSDKLVHVAVYLVLGMLAMRAARRPHGSPGHRDDARSLVQYRPAAFIVLLLCVGYGISDELHQLAVPGRYASVWDGLADAIGATIGVSLAWWRDRRAASATIPS